MIKSMFKFIPGWVYGVIIAGIIMSLWQNEKMDWNQIVVVSIAGITGAIIVSGFRYFYKKHEA